VFYDEDRDIGFDFDHEFQAAFALSEREREPDDRAAVRDIVAAGRFAVVLNTPEFCRFTDALLGNVTTLVSSHDTRAEAEAACPASEEEPVEPLVLERPTLVPDGSEDDDFAF
jgi:hypothetical protein